MARCGGEFFEARDGRFDRDSGGVRRAVGGWAAQLELHAATVERPDGYLPAEQEQGEQADAEPRFADVAEVLGAGSLTHESEAFDAEGSWKPGGRGAPGDEETVGMPVDGLPDRVRPQGPEHDQQVGEPRADRSGENPEHHAGARVPDGTPWWDGSGWHRVGHGRADGGTMRRAAQAGGGGPLSTR